MSQLYAASDRNITGICTGSRLSLVDVPSLQAGKPCLYIVLNVTAHAGGPICRWFEPALGGLYASMASLLIMSGTQCDTYVAEALRQPVSPDAELHHCQRTMQTSTARHCLHCRNPFGTCWLLPMPRPNTGCRHQHASRSLCRAPSMRIACKRIIFQVGNTPWHAKEQSLKATLAVAKVPHKLLSAQNIQ
jgi:hypothetical protein